MGSWQLEVFKMSLYMIFPLGVWYGFNTDYYQKHYFHPFLKVQRPDVYKALYVSDDDDERAK